MRDAPRIPRVRVVLVGTEGEINLGFAARISMNFGVNELYLVTPKIDPFNHESLRFSAKARDLLIRAVVVDSLADALKGTDVSACTSARVGADTDIVRNAITPREFANLATEYSSVAIVFGRESVGLTREEILQCDLLVAIPAHPSYPVLNLTHAMAIVLYELWLARSKVTTYHKEAKADQLERIKALFNDIAREVLDKERFPHVIAAIHHCIAKARLTRGEASALYYFAKRILSRLKEGDASCR